MNLEECAKLEEKYARLAVEQANAIKNPEQKVTAALSVVSRLNDARVNLTIEQQHSFLYRTAQTTLLAATLTLAGITGYVASETTRAHETEKAFLRQERTVIEQLAKEREAASQSRYDMLAGKHRELTTEYSQLQQLSNAKSETISKYAEKHKILEVHNKRFRESFCFVVDEYIKHQEKCTKEKQQQSEGMRKNDTELQARKSTIDGLTREVGCFQRLYHEAEDRCDQLEEKYKQDILELHGLHRECHVFSSYDDLSRRLYKIHEQLDRRIAP